MKQYELEHGSAWHDHAGQLGKLTFVCSANHGDKRRWMVIEIESVGGQRVELTITPRKLLVRSLPKRKRAKKCG